MKMYSSLFAAKGVFGITCAYR